MLYPSMTAHCDGHQPHIHLEPGQRTVPIFETLPCDAEIVLPARFSTDTPAGVAYAIAHLEAQGWHVGLDPVDDVHGRDFDDQLTNGWATVTCPKTVTPDDYPESDVEPLDDEPAAPETESLIDEPTATPPPTLKRTHGKHLSAEESERVDDILRQAYKGERVSRASLAQMTGLSEPSVKRRVDKRGLSWDKASAPATKAALAKPKPAPIAPPPPPSKAGVDRHRVPALGARRRILSLYAIGYDHRILNARLSTTDVTVGAILPLEDTDMIPQATFDVIDQLWQRLRTVPMTPNPAVNPDRSSPPPSAWTNIDDPDEQPEVKR